MFGQTSELGERSTRVGFEPFLAGNSFGRERTGELPCRLLDRFECRCFHGGRALQQSGNDDDRQTEPEHACHPDSTPPTC